MESAGLAASLARFARAYAHAWRREVAQHTGWFAADGDEAAAADAAAAEGDSAGGGEQAAGVAGPDAGAGRPRPAQGGQAQHEAGAEADPQFSLTAKRVATLVGLGVSVPTLMVWNHVGFWLDSVLYGDWKDQEVHRPVFIVGNARSGTTWAHRVLAEDDTHFTAPQLWEMAFAQSITWRVLFFRLSLLDRRLGAPVARLLRKIDDTALGQARVHKFGLWRIEEDEWMMMNIAACQLSALMFPLIDDFRDLIYFDSSLSAKERRVIFDYYRACIQRHLYAHDLMEEMRFQERIRIRDRARGGKRPRTQRAMSLALMSPESTGSRRTLARADSYSLDRATSGPTSVDSARGGAVDLRKKNTGPEQGREWFRRRRVRYLSKNPTFTLRIRSLLETFPDANVVVMVRDPFRAIPSMLSYISQCWRFFASPTVKYPYRDALTHMCSLHYTYPVEVCNSDPRAARQMCFLHYELCVDDLVKSFTALYAHLGLSMTGRMAASLMDEAKLSRQYASSHRYNILETTGLTLPAFIARHRAAFEIYPAYARGFDFARGPTPASPSSNISTRSSGSGGIDADGGREDAGSSSGSSSSFALVPDGSADDDKDEDDRDPGGELSDSRSLPPSSPRAALAFNEA